MKLYCNDIDITVIDILLLLIFIIVLVVHETRRQKLIRIVDERSFIIYPWFISIVK